MPLSQQELEEIGDCIELIGGPELPAAICSVCMKLCEAEFVYLSAFFEKANPVALYTNHTEQIVHDALAQYIDVAYILDPFFDYFRSDGGDAVLRLNDVAPDGFKKSEYYQRFYHVLGLKDECGLFVRFGGEAALFVSLGVLESSSRIKIAKLQQAMPLVVPILRRHWTVLTPERTDSSTRVAALLEHAFETFGSSCLSPRECEILRMILKGHSSKSIAREFGNSPETIKVHRRRAYSKLGVGSQGELLSLFIEALRYTPLSSQRDPLEHLREARPV